MNAIIANWTGRLRRHLLSDVEADVARLAHELAQQRDALARQQGDLERQRQELAQQRYDLKRQRECLADPERLRPLIAPALGAAAARSPEEMAAALRPIVEELAWRRQRGATARRRRRRAVALAAAAALVAFGAGATVVAPGLWSATAGAPPAATARPPGAPASTLQLEQTDAAFGLGRAGVGDDELSRAVRARLEERAELAGARLSFAVKDGWVWLRGQADESARRVADEALADLGDEVVVVNQIVDHRPTELVARPPLP